MNQLYKSVCLNYQSYNRPHKYLWQNKNSICIHNKEGVTCFITPHEKTDTLYVVFKGTTTFNELRTSLSASLELRGHPIMHRGYLNKYLSVHNKINHIIKKQPRMKDIVFTGHSYGGGLSVAASMMTRLFSDTDQNIKCITFASPKCVNAEYLDLFEHDIPHLSIENVLDPIPYISFHPDLKALPNKLLLDSRQSTDIFLLDLFGHHSTICYKSLVQDIQCNEQSRGDLNIKSCLLLDADSQTEISC